MLMLCSLKTLGDKSYEFLLVIFLIKYMKKGQTKFLIGTRDNHFINSLFINIIPLIRELNRGKDKKEIIDIGFYFRNYARHTEKGDKSNLLVFNEEIFKTPTTSLENDYLKVLFGEEFSTPLSSPKRLLEKPLLTEQLSPEPPLREQLSPEQLSPEQPLT